MDAVCLAYQTSGFLCREVYKRVLNHEDALIIRSKQNAQFQNVLKQLAKPDTLRWNLASLCAVEYHRQRSASLA